MGQGLGAGLTQRAETEDGHRAFLCQRWHIGLPAVLQCDGPVDFQMVAQHVAGDPFDHGLGEARINHPTQGLGQGFIAGDLLNACPKVQNRLAARVGAKILHIRIRCIDDVVDVFGCKILTQIDLQPIGDKCGFERGLIGLPAFGTGGKQGVDHVAKTPSISAKPLTSMGLPAGS